MDNPNSQFDFVFEIEKCLKAIEKIKNYLVDSYSADDVVKHTQMILRADYAKYLRQSYSEPSHLIDIFKINQILLYVLNLFVILREKKKLDQWFKNVKEYQWKFFILQNIIMMGNEIQMNLELNLAFSSLAKVRQYFELYAIHYLIKKYGLQVFDHFMIHGIKNMQKFENFFKPFNHKEMGGFYYFTRNYFSRIQIRNPYGWMRKIKGLEVRDRKIKNIIQKGISNDKFLRHIYLHSNFPNHASSFMFATYADQNNYHVLSRHASQMVFHTYLWLLKVFLNSFIESFERIDNHQMLVELNLIKKTLSVFKNYIEEIQNINVDKLHKSSEQS